MKNCPRSIVCTLFLGLIFILFHTTVIGQNNSEKATLKDTLDGKLDFSEFLLKANGFFPMPQIITEPAFGGFGLAIAPVFIHPNKHASKTSYTPPNITVGAIGYTANKSWFTGLMRIASLPQYGLKYRVGMAYANMNMDFYRETNLMGEQKYAFNFKSVPIFGTITKEIGSTNLYLGLSYFFMKSEVTPKFDFTQLPDFITDKSLDNIQSAIGVVAEYDRRDNVFTPNKGVFLIGKFNANAEWTGSDFDFQNLHFTLFKYFQTTSKLVSGFRVETQFQFGDAPFYLKPGLDMRGVPMARYQGDETYIVETEQRYDFSLRWSGVVFGGLAKAVPESKSFSEERTVYTYGAGFRYLIARKFNIRAGIDLAGSNEDFGYYIVFGSAWNNRG